MRHSTKLLLNTGASYLRIIANGIVTLIVTRIALNALGVDDYGLYNLLAGTIALLSFVNTALLISSQRFFSIAIGKKDMTLLQKYFSSSLTIHLFLSIGIIIFLLGLQPLLFDLLLNINPNQVHVARIIYQIMIASTCITMNCVPFAALMNAYEDIAALSFINIGSYIIRLFAALSLLVFHNHLLILFSSIILLSICFKLIAESVWCRMKYKSVRINIRGFFDKNICKEMSGFTGWNTLGSFSVLFRDEGVAITLNFFFGTAINAAYGIANQVNSLVLSFAGNLTTVFTPSIIQAKGAGNEERMRFLAILTSKISFLLSSLIALPIVLFLHKILSLWLKIIPPYTEVFCKYIIFCFLIQMLYTGINRMIYASGQIRNYQLGMTFAFVGILPIAIVLFKVFHMPPSVILLVVIISQFIVLLLSLFTAHKNCGLKLRVFSIRGLLVPIVLFLVLFFLGQLIKEHMSYSSEIGFVLGASFVIDLVYSAIYFLLVFNSQEKEMINTIFLRLFKKS